MPRVVRPAAAVLLVLATACGGDAKEDKPEPQATSALSIVARAKGASVPVFKAPDAPVPSMSLSNPNEDGAPRVFLIKNRRPGWLEALLPVRPNGSRGWIRESDVSVRAIDYRVKIELNRHRLTAWKGPTVIADEPIGVGRANTPTPGGEYYITELLRPPDPKGVYGPFAFGLSGFSDVYRSFAGGTGAVGVHGTNDPTGLGKDVSAGCIRMSNEAITKLAYALPVGTPVDIVA